MKMLRIIGGLSGLACTVLGTVMTFYSTYLSRRFSWSVNAISDLGVDPDAAVVFNSSIIATGILFIVFVAGLYSGVAVGRWGKAGVLSLFLGGVSLALAGVFTVAYVPHHIIVASGYFILVPLGITFIGSSRAAGFVSENVRVVSLISGPSSIIALIVTLPVLNTLGIRVGFAVPEMAESMILSAWTVFMSLKMLYARD